MHRPHDSHCATLPLRNQIKSSHGDGILYRHITTPGKCTVKGGGPCHTSASAWTVGKLRCNLHINRPNVPLEPRNMIQGPRWWPVTFAKQGDHGHHTRSCRMCSLFRHSRVCHPPPQTQCTPQPYQVELLIAVCSKEGLAIDGGVLLPEAVDHRSSPASDSTIVWYHCQNKGVA